MKGLGVTILIILVLGCFDRKGESFPIPRPQTLPEFSFPDISYEEYHNKILGFLVGSAIGDAMGSPVEMWSAGQIEDRFGFIDKLIINSRASSAEGPWGSNLPAGTGTDDTYKKTVGLPLEIVPLNDPYRTKPGDEMSFMVLWGGKPLEFTLVKVWNRKNNNTILQNIYTQKDGIITTRLSNTGMWMVSCIKMIPSKDTKADWQSYWASYTFGYD